MALPNLLNPTICKVGKVDLWDHLDSETIDDIADEHQVAVDIVPKWMSKPSHRSAPPSTTPADRLMGPLSPASWQRYVRGFPGARCCDRVAMVERNGGAAIEGDQ